MKYILSWLFFNLIHYLILWNSWLSFSSKASRLEVHHKSLPDFLNPPWSLSTPNFCLFGDFLLKLTMEKMNFNVCIFFHFPQCFALSRGFRVVALLHLIILSHILEFVFLEGHNNLFAHSVIFCCFHISHDDSLELLSLSVILRRYNLYFWPFCFFWLCLGFFFLLRCSRMKSILDIFTEILCVEIKNVVDVEFGLSGF